jgi:type II secretory pathway pseudopilin PulG
MDPRMDLRLDPSPDLDLDRSSRTGRQAGFTLVEALVSLFVTSLVLLGVLAMVDFSTKVSRAQGYVAEMQQSLRVAQADAVRLVRMAGRGGLPLGAPPAGQALAVRNNVGDDEHIGGDDTPAIVPGTDVVTVRGVFSAPLYQIPQDPTAFTLDSPGGVPASGTFLLGSTTPTGIPQDLSALVEAVQSGTPEALILVSARDASIFAVVELDPASSDVSDPAQITVGFLAGGGTHGAEYALLNPSPGTYPATLTQAAFVGLLEEHSFYVRQELAVAGDATSEATPKLSRARVFPGTLEPYRGDAGNWSLDIADNIIDLQVAFGVDTPNGGCSLEEDPVGCAIAESADGLDDDWLFNAEEAADPAIFGDATLHYVRWTTVARTDGRDPGYQAPVLVRLEDHDYGGAGLNDRSERMYRRRLLETVIDMRNL